MNICFVSNYINHHQIPFCEAMCELTGGHFTFVQTRPMETERIQMGWKQQENLDFVKCFYEEEALCRQLIAECDVVLFGGCEEESYVEERLKNKKVLFRVDERLYKEGQWKAISPRGLIKKYKDHVRYRKEAVYFLCAGGYVASDLALIHAYPQKKLRWGYFPQTRQYDLDQLWQEKKSTKTGVVHLLWAGRFLDWKHPEHALLTAKYLQEKGLSFHLDMIGDGPLFSQMDSMCTSLGLQESVSLLGYQNPDVVREYMEQADVYLLTSDRHEGWGAVVNEAMNSALAVVGNHMAGAVPFLIQQGKNGFLYRDQDTKELFVRVEELVRNKELRESLGRAAYETITECWNAKEAAKRLMQIFTQVVDHRTLETPTDGPCSLAPAIPERKMYRYLTGRETCRNYH